MFGDVELVTTGGDSSSATARRGLRRPPSRPTCGGGDVGAPADVYALGAILFELLAGQPLRARTTDGIAAIPGERPSRRAPAAEVPPELDDACARALAVDPSARPTARETSPAPDPRPPSTATAIARSAPRSPATRLARAQRAFISPDTAVHATALREAGRAVALDPTLPGAAELVTRIMLDPPRVMPAALADTVAADRLATVRRMSRAVFYAYAAYLVFAPAFLWLGAGRGGDAVVLTVVVAVNAALLARQGFTSARPIAPVVAIGNVMLVALIARLWSPFLAAPGVAAITTMVSAMSPLYRHRRWVAAMAAGMALAIIGMFLAELVGVLSPTTTSIPDGFEITAAGLHLTHDRPVPVVGDVREAR